MLRLPSTFRVLQQIAAHSCSAETETWRLSWAHLVVHRLSPKSMNTAIFGSLLQILYRRLQNAFPWGCCWLSRSYVPDAPPIPDPAYPRWNNMRLYRKHRQRIVLINNALLNLAIWQWYILLCSCTEQICYQCLLPAVITIKYLLASIVSN
jgi:hypothetical protein